MRLVSRWGQLCHGYGSPKIKHRLKKKAYSVLYKEERKGKEGLNVFKCKYCDHWHLGRRVGYKERMDEGTDLPYDDREDRLEVILSWMEED